MADFCSNCHRDMGFPGEPDYDIEMIAQSLDPGFVTGVLCEGCAMIGVGRSEEDEIIIINYDGTSQVWDPEQDRMAWYESQPNTDETNLQIT